MIDHIEIAQATNGEWFLRFVAANDETTATSETYDTKFNAVRAAQGWQRSIVGVANDDSTFIIEAGQ